MLSDIVNKPRLRAAPAHLRLGDRRLLWLMLGSIYSNFIAIINHGETLTVFMIIKI